jgi:FKBP-type peptidyl-prolyl cis-trans isomerase FkpA
MKKYLILFSLLIIGLSSCQKLDSTVVAGNQAIVDDAKIQAYLTANKLSYTKDASGIYYQIVNPGTDPKPTSSSIVKITYSYGYLNGVAIGSVVGIQAKLSGFNVAGLRVGVTKIGTGGRIMIIVPSGLAHGSTATDNIPGNSILVYTIDLIGIPAS